MSYLKRFISWLVSLFVHEAVEQVKEEINKPNTMTDENVPNALKSALDASLNQQLQHPESSHTTDRGGAVGK